MYLDGVSEPAAERVEDPEAVVQSEELSVLTEEVDQRAALLLQLLAVAAQRAQRRRRTLTQEHETTGATLDRFGLQAAHMDVRGNSVSFLMDANDPVLSLHMSDPLMEDGSAGCH